MLDTLATAKQLQSVKFSAAQAEAIATLLAIRDGEIVTKDDLAMLKGDLVAKMEGGERRLDAKIDGVEQRLDAKINGVEQRLDAKIDTKVDGLRKDMQVGFADLKTEIAVSQNKLLIWIIGFQVTAAGLIIALLKFL